MLGVRRKIMVAVDGSAVSDKAVYEAVWLACCQAGKFKNKLFAVFVKADRVRDYDDLFVKGISAEDEISERWQQIVDHAFLVIKKLAAEKEVPLETIVIEGEPAASINHLVHKHDIDLLVVGSTGKGAVKRAFLGSVSAELIEHAPCGVYIVRA
ncbi:MAG: universal stress protein [Deltaproteobacteria bacterium]|nr:MAG: universal stress protein [Deltaproteobacteria bacterium]